MYIGYFFEYTPFNILIFFGFLILLFLSIFQYLIKNNLFYSFYTWAFFFLLFPKKSLVLGLDSVLQNLIKLPNELLIGTHFSFYDIVNAMILFSITFKISKILSSNQNNLSKRLITIFTLLFLAAILQNIYFNFFLINQLGSNYLDQFHYTLQIIEGILFSFVLFYSIQNKKHINLIFNIAIFASLTVLIEFYLVSFTDLLPDFVKYFSIDYRGGFRSFIHSGSLMTGFILFIGFLGLIYKRNYFSIFLGLLFIPVIFYTYERSIFLLFVITILLFSIHLILTVAKNNVHIFIYVTTLFLILFPLYNAQFENLVDNVNENLNTSSYVDGGRIKNEGWFAFQSSSDRKALLVRGLDVFYSYPLLGCGPGNIRLMMSNSSIPARSNIYKMSQEEIQGYNDLISGYHITNTHNLYINIIAEFGIIGIIFLFTIINIFLSKILATSISDKRKIVGLCGLTSLLSYGLFQIEPLSFPLYIFLLRILDLDDN